MPWKDYSSDDEGKTSDWNAAAFKMKRLDKALATLNDINSNPKAFNVENGVYNYELRFNQCDALYLEVESKLTDEERKVGEDLRNKIKIMLERFPVHTVSVNQFYKTKRHTVSPHVYKVLERLLFNFEKLVRRYIDDHGMDTSYDDESALF